MRNRIKKVEKRLKKQKNNRKTMCVWNYYELVNGWDSFNPVKATRIEYSFIQEFRTNVITILFWNRGNKNSWKKSFFSDECGECLKKKVQSMLITQPPQKKLRKMKSHDHNEIRPEKQTVLLCTRSHLILLLCKPLINVY